MHTVHNGPHRIEGSCPEGYTKRPQVTAKAVLVNVHWIEGIDPALAFRAGSVWVPRSICTSLEVFEAEEDGAKYTAVRATVPAWFVRKLDDRAGWEKAGHARAPMATRPF